MHVDAYGYVQVLVLCSVFVFFLRQLAVLSLFCAHLYIRTTELKCV